MQSKGKKVLNFIIVIVIIAILCIIGYLAYYYISNYIAKKEAEEAVEAFENDILVGEYEDEGIVDENSGQTNNSSSQGGSKKTSTTTYKGYTMIGTIQIPRTNLKAPIVDKVTPNSISAAVATLYGPGLNEIGNTVLVAHNYRNGTFFSNNKLLQVGDKIYITDVTGTKVEYSIYKTYTTSDMDFSYATRDTNGKREISLSTCTTDASKRLVIWARET